MSYLIVHADDLGLQYSFNHGILLAHQKGMLTSTCLRANGLALEHAIEEVVKASPQLGLGVHLCLNEGRAVASSKSVNSLVDDEGYFRNMNAKGFIYLAFSGANKRLVAQTEVELRAQIEKLLQYVELDHINGHMHVHAIPWIFDLTVKLAEEYKIPYVRMPWEPMVWESFKVSVPTPPNIFHFLNLKRWCMKNKRTLARHRVRCNDTFYGLLYTSTMAIDVVKVLLSKPPRGKITEALFHPTKEGNPQDTEFITPNIKNYCSHPNRQLELEAVLSQDLKDAVNAKYTMTNYRNMVRENAGGN